MMTPTRICSPVGLAIRFVLVVLISNCCVEGCGRHRHHGGGHGGGRRCPPRDRTPPTLTCPSDISVNNRPIQNHQQVSWTEPIANDNGREITPTRNGLPPGFLFNEGVTRITYSARDSSGNVRSCSFKIIVTVVRCSPFRRQANGFKWCHPSDDMRYGGLCRFGCYSGFKLIGSRSISCLESGQWTDHQPSCQKITCDALYPPANVADITCSDSNNYRSICSYNCKEGYGVRQGTSKVRVCGAAGNWIGNQPSCVDVTPPTFTNCPYVVVGYAESSKTSWRPSWTVPSASDNGGDVTVKKTPGPSRGEELPVGEYSVTYTATDAAGNTADCTFKLIVKQIRCKNIYPLPYTDVLCASGQIYGSMCSFSCDTNGTVLNGNGDAQCQKSDTTVPYGIWSYNKANLGQPYCELVDLCPDLIPPDNGALACDTWLGGNFCKMLCQSGYVTTETDKHKTMHVCDKSGEWSQGTVMPPCMKLNGNTRFFLIKLNYLYYNGSCTEDHEEIKTNFLQSIRQTVGDKCFVDNTCTEGTVEVTCGNQTDQSRKKRSIGGFVIQLRIEMSNLMDVGDQLTLRNGVKTALTESGAVLTVKGIQYNSHTVEVSQLECQCQRGTVYDEFNAGCVKCGSGYYHNVQTNACIKCEKGTYQAHSGTTSCVLCPAGKTTPTLGATSIADCLDACAVGTYSKTGVKPCSQCDVGTYIDAPASIACLLCPGTKTTLTPGAHSVSHCQHIDIEYVALPKGEAAVPAKLTVNTTTARSGMVFWFYHKSTSHCRNLVNISNGETKVFELVNQDGLTANVLGSNYTSTNNDALKQDIWHFVNVSFHDSKLEMFVDETRMFSRHAPEISGDWIPASVNVTLGGPDCVGSFSQFNMNKTIGTGKHPRTSCANGEKGDLLSWKDFIETADEGTYYPQDSQCDVINNCESTPCQKDGTCTDLYKDYLCTCPDGFSGKSCEVNLDDCQDHACDNEATCVDGDNEYTCECPPGYKGELCEIKVVDGNWGPWGNWSGCSVTCGEGVHTRKRVCDNPAPDNGGQECDGGKTDTGTCQGLALTAKECVNECSTPLTVVNGTMNCSVEPTDNETVLCTPQCYEGYDFDSDFLVVNYTIACGVNTTYVWNVKTEDNPNGTLPSCLKKEIASQLTLNYEGHYSVVQTSDKTQMETTINNKISSEQCIANGQCNSVFETNNDDNDKRRRRSTSGTPFVLTVTCTPVTSVVNECYDLLASIVIALNEAVNNLDLTVTIDNQNYDVDINSTDIDGTATCMSGSVPVQHYCIPCGRGMYQAGEFCERCPRGYYQDTIRQMACKQCPEGWTTLGLQSETATQCSVYVKQDDESQELLSFVIMGVVTGVLLISVTVVGLALVKKCGKRVSKSNKNWVKPADTNGNEHFDRWKLQDATNSTLGKKANVFTLKDMDLDGEQHPRPASRNAWIRFTDGASTSLYDSGNGTPDPPVLEPGFATDTDMKKENSDFRPSSRLAWT